MSELAPRNRFPRRCELVRWTRNGREKWRVGRGLLLHPGGKRVCAAGARAAAPHRWVQGAVLCNISRHILASVWYVGEAAARTRCLLWRSNQPRDLDFRRGTCRQNYRAQAWRTPTCARRAAPLLHLGARRSHSHSGSRCWCMQEMRCQVTIHVRLRTHHLLTRVLNCNVSKREFLRSLSVLGGTMRSRCKPRYRRFYAWVGG